MANLGLSSRGLYADVSPSGIFGDHMILQQDIKLPVSRNGTPGETVTASAGSETGRTTVSPDGSWIVHRPSLAPQKDAITVTIGGKNTIVLKDVLVGRVYFESGQPIMHFAIRNDDGPIEHGIFPNRRYE
jgi:sialate O-acetylesterase